VEVDGGPSADGFGERRNLALRSKLATSLSETEAASLFGKNFVWALCPSPVRAIGRCTPYSGPIGPANTTLTVRSRSVAYRFARLRILPVAGETFPQIKGKVFVR